MAIWKLCFEFSGITQLSLKFTGNVKRILTILGHYALKG